MERALVIGASGGIGAAICDALDHVVRVSRSEDGLEVTDPASVERVLGGIDGPFDLIIVALGVLGIPEKSLAAIEAEAMAKIFAVNAIGPAQILRHLPRLLAQGGTCGVLSARVGSIGDNQIGGWHSYRASKAALNQIVRGAAIEIGRKNKNAKVVALHPGTVETQFTEGYAGRHKMVSPDVAACNLLRVLKGLTPEQSGGFFAYDGTKIPW